MASVIAVFVLSLVAAHLHGQQVGRRLSDSCQHGQTSGVSLDSNDAAGAHLSTTSNTRHHHDPAYAAQADRRCLSVYERQHLHIKKNVRKSGQRIGTVESFTGV